MLLEREVKIAHAPLYRWVQRYASEMEKQLSQYWKNAYSGDSWCIDETYVRVSGKWAYLYRAVDKYGHTIDFYLSSGR